MSATFLGDTRVGAKDRFHFNAFLHMDILGSICYLVGGFGWPRTMDDRSQQIYPSASLYDAHPVGRAPWPTCSWPVSPAVVATLMKTIEWNPRVFLMVIGVNITTAIYNLSRCRLWPWVPWFAS